MGTAAVFCARFAMCVAFVGEMRRAVPSRTAVMGHVFLSVGEGAFPPFLFFVSWATACPAVVERSSGRRHGYLSTNTIVGNGMPISLSSNATPAVIWCEIFRIGT